VSSELETEEGHPDRRANPAPTRLQRWLRPPRVLRPTRAGWLFFGITLGVGFAALNTGNNLLYLVLSLLLAFLVLSGVLSESSLRGIRVRRRIPRELEAASNCSVVLEVSNDQRRFAAFAIVVVDFASWPSASAVESGRTFALRIGPGETVRRHYRFEPKQRGIVKFEEFQVFTRFPFGLFSKSLRISAPQSALVYPELEHVDARAILGSPQGSGEQISSPGGVGTDAVGLRDYRAGDPVRRIHWRASIRKRELLVREVESERDAEFEVRLRTGDVSEGEAFERAISWAASEVSSLLNYGTRVSLRTDRDFIPSADGLRQRSELLSFLAMVRPDHCDVDAMHESHPGSAAPGTAS
jgi:uncharacterized protein (DUF58 family)